MAAPLYASACTVIRNVSGGTLRSAEFARLHGYASNGTTLRAGALGITDDNGYFYVPGDLESYFAAWHPGLTGRRMFTRFVKRLEDAITTGPTGNADGRQLYEIVSLPGTQAS